MILTSTTQLENAMKINSQMNLSELAEHMGEATEEEAATMRDLLVETGETDLADIDEAAWSDLLAQVIEAHQ